MSDTVIVRINEKLIPELQINYNADTNVANHRDISTWADITVTSQQKLILIVAANMVLSKEVKIPSKNEEIIRQSIPFALEEFLANDIDENHYAYWQLAEHSFLVSVIQKSTIENIQIELNNHGLDCKQMLSELFTVPYHLGKLSMLSFEGYSIIREGHSGTVVANNMLKTYIESSDLEEQICYAEQDIELSEFPNAEIKRINIPLLQAMTVTSQDSVNLFQAQYSQQDERSKSKSPVLKMLGLIVVLVVSWIAINGYKLFDLSNQIDSIKDKQAKLLQTLIPNASETERRDPYSAIQSRLKVSQNNKSTKSDGGFIQSLHYIGRTLLDHPSIQVQSLRQRGGKLEISIRTQDMGKLNAFQSSLKNNVLAMRVKTGTREVNNNGVNSVITMESMQ